MNLLTELNRMAMIAEEHAKLAVANGRHVLADQLFMIADSANDLLVASGAGPEAMELIGEVMEGVVA